MQPITNRLFFFIILISATRYHITMHCAAPDMLEEKLLTTAPQHEFTKQLSTAVFDNDVNTVKHYLKEKNADPNAVHHNNKSCNNRLTRSLANCCSSESKRTISLKSYIVPVCLALSGVITGTISVFNCSLKNSDWDIYCLSHSESRDFYCDHKPGKTWAQFCNDSPFAGWCKSISHMYGVPCSINPDCSCLCDLITKPHEPWVNSCPRLLDNETCNRFNPLQDECTPPTVSPCAYSSITYELIGASTPILIALALIHRIDSKKVGKDSYWWKKKANYAIEDKTPLMIAAQKINAAQPDNKQIIQLLLENKAQVNTTDTHGNTALMLAAHAHNIPAIEILCLAGADINLTNRDGNTALTGATPEVLHTIHTNKPYFSNAIPSEIDSNQSTTNYNKHWSEQEQKNVLAFDYETSESHYAAAAATSRDYEVDISYTSN